MGQPSPEISVVIPVYNEALNLDEMIKRLVAVLESTGRPFEIVGVDDGSTDDSLAALKGIAANEPRLRILSLLRNFGQQPALFAGFAHVRGQVVVMIDADLQNPPEELPKLFAKLDEGYDVVWGWREDRQDSIFRKTISKSLNALVSHILKATIHDLGCGMKVFRRDVIDRMCKATHHNRYMPAEIMWLGVKIAEVKVAHTPRQRGKSKYNIINLLHLNFDMLASISTFPIKVMEMAGWFFSMCGASLVAFDIAYWLVKGAYSPFTIVMTVFFLLAGIQMVATSIMCEYISRIYIEVQNRPYYVVKDVIE